MSIELGDGRRLVLAVGREGWLWVAVGLAALALLVTLYRYERRLVPPRVGLVLLGLRLLMATALMVVLLEPIAARSWTERVKGRVVLGVDLSASMATSDDRRPVDERRSLAEAPGLAAVEPGDDPLSRRAIARRILQGDAIGRLDAAHDLDAYGFAREAAPARVAELAEALGRDVLDGPGSPLITDWSAVLDRALAGDEAAPLGVVLLTDGRRNGPGGAEELADRLAGAGVPVFPVLVGSTVGPRDAAIAAIRAPASGYAGDVAPVLVEVKADGFEPGDEVAVTLEIAGREPLREVVRPGDGGGRPVAAFRVPLEEAGPLELVATVDPPGDGDDARPDNDRRPALIRVSDDKARVLLVEAEARWEFHFLHNALLRDERVEPVAVVLRQPPPSGVSGETFPAALPAAPDPDSAAADPLGEFDVIVLGDLPPEEAPAGLWARLETFVADRGGTLIVAAGPRSWPDGWLGDPTAGALLPVVEPGPLPVDPEAIDPERPALPPGVLLVPSAEVMAAPADWPMLQFAADSEASRAVWAGLPPMPWALAGRAKPGASSLLVDGGTAGTGEAMAVVASQPYGLGKVLWVGTDGTWRWRLRVGDAYHHRFWGQVVRWAAGASPTGGNRLVRFGPESPQVAEGEPIVLRARFDADAPGITAGLLAAARVFRESDDGATPAIDARPLAIVPLRPSPDRPRTFEATAPALPAGRYLAVLDVPALADAFAAEGLPRPEASVEVVPPVTDELIELAAARDPLDRLASLTGGEVLRDAEAGRLPELIAARVVEETHTEQTPLWDTPAGLVALFALLAVEWTVRKRAGLP